MPLICASMSASLIPLSRNARLLNSSIRLNLLLISSSGEFLSIAILRCGFVLGDLLQELIPGGFILVRAYLASSFLKLVRLIFIFWHQSTFLSRFEVVNR